MEMKSMNNERKKRKSKVKVIDIDSPNSLWAKIWRRKNFDPKFEIKQTTHKELVSFPKPDFRVHYQQERRKKKSYKWHNNKRFLAAKKILGKDNPIIRKIRNQISLSHRELVSHYLDEKAKMWQRRNSEIQ